MGFGISKISKHRKKFKFMLSTAVIFDMLEDLNCLSQEEFFKKLLFQKDNYAILLTLNFSK